MMIRTSFFALLSLVQVHWISGQTATRDSSKSEIQLSPQAAYERSIRPLEITRRSPQNWSEIELNALKVARENAQAECAARNPDQTTNSDLLPLARLCSFALQWQPVREASSKYLGTAPRASDAGAKGLPYLSLAFDYEVLACLNLKDEDGALSASRLMLQSVPYDVFVSEATNSTAEAVRFTRVSQAMELLKQRQPGILGRIKSFGTLDKAPATDSAQDASTNSSFPLHALYRDALALPLYLQFMNQPPAAAASYAELESTLPMDISPEDAMYIAEDRDQYLLLGKHLPSLNLISSLSSPSAALPQEINTRFENAAVFVLFPDWCDQCIQLGIDSKAKRDELATAKVRLFLLMAQASVDDTHSQISVINPHGTSEVRSGALTHHQKVRADQQAGTNTSPEVLLKGTPTLIVPNETLTDFAATDYPLIIAAGRNGMVRWMQRASEHALDSDGDIDRIVNQVLAHWPPEPHPTDATSSNMEKR
jgi:hypothetical protein